MRESQPHLSERQVEYIAEESTCRIAAKDAAPSEYRAIVRETAHEYVETLTPEQRPRPYSEHILDGLHLLDASGRNPHRS